MKYCSGLKPQSVDELVQWMQWCLVFCHEKIYELQFYMFIVRCSCTQVMGNRPPLFSKVSDKAPVYFTD